MRYPPQVLDQIKARLNLVDEVRRSIPTLKKKGPSWWANCPFHNEKSASFHVREDGPAGGNYYCFGCGAAGDIFTFVMETQGSDFTQTVKDLAKRAGVRLPEAETQDPAQQSRREQGYKALERAEAFFRSHLGNPGATAYLQRRGLSPATVEEFGLGYAPESWSATRDALTQEGIGIPVLRETGLSIESDKGRGDYDRFRGRLMFPIHDLQGRTVGFGGRILEQGEPKYLNSPETPFFSKSFLLYNLNRARPHMRQSKQAILVEGYMDVIALWQAGLKTAVAPMGTSVTEDQLSLLWQQAEKPTVCLDGDAAGRNAAIRVAQKLLPILEPGRSVQFVWLPDGEDPDSLIRKDGLAAFHTLLAQPTALEDVLWQHLTAGHDLAQADAKAKVEAELGTLMATIRNATVRKAYSQALRDKLWQATRGPQRQAKAAAQTTMAPTGYRPAPVADLHARTLLALTLRWPEILPEAAETLAQLEFPAGELADLTHALMRGFTQGQDGAALVATLQTGLFETTVADLLRATGVAALEEETNAHRLFADHLSQWQSRQQSRSRRQALLQQLRSGDLDEDKWQQIRQLQHSVETRVDTTSQGPHLGRRPNRF